MSYHYYSYNFINENFYNNTEYNSEKIITNKITFMKYFFSNDNHYKDCPLITIITVVLNGEKFLEQTIKSVIEQTYSNIEYIIIDGNSKDGTTDIIKKFEKYIAYWVSEPDNGIYDAMNKGIKKSNGKIIGIINSGDYYSHDAVEIIVKNFYLNDMPDILFGDMCVLNERANLRKIVKPYIKKIKYGMSLNHPTCFVKKELYNERLFDINYKIVGDYELMLYFYQNNFSFLYIPQLISYFRTGGISSNFISTKFESFFVQKEKFGLFLSFRNLFLKFILKGFYIILLFFIPEKILLKIRGFK